MKQSTALLAALLLAATATPIIAQNCENPNSTFEFVGNVNTYFCEGPNGLVTVDITVDQNNDPACIDKMILDWGDGTVENLAANDFSNHTHIYYYPDSIACKLTPDQLNPDVKLTLYFKNTKLNKRTQSLAISPLPRASISAKAPLCVNKPVQFNVVGDCYVDSVRWDFGNGNVSNLENPTFTYTTGGVKSIELCVFNQCGKKCVTQNIFILDQPDVSAIAVTANPTSGCFPMDVKLNATVKQVFDYDWSVVPVTPCTGCWQFVAPNGKDSISPVIRITKEGRYRVLLTGKNDCGQDTLSVLVQAYGPPILNFTGNPVGCKTFAYTPTVTYSNVNPNSIATYKWTFPKGSPMMSTAVDPGVIQYVNNGTGLLSDTIRLTVTGPCGSQTIQQVVKVYGDTEVKFQPIGQVCTGQQPFVIPVTPAPPLGSFSIVPTTPALNINTGEFDPSKAVPGDYTVTYTVKIVGAANCESSASTMFTIKTSLPVSLNTPDKFCLDAPIQTITLAPASGGILTGDGVLDSLGNQYSPAKAGIGPDVLLFSYKDPATGCRSTVSKPVEIIGIPSAKAPDTIPTCHIPQPVDLLTLGAFVFSPNPAGATTVFSGPGVTPSGKFTSPGPGNYTLSVTYAVPPGCDTTTNFVVKVSAYVTATAGANATVCKSQMKYQLDGQPGGGKWAGPGVDPMTGVIDLSNLAPGTYPYTYTLAKDSPCESSAIVSITVIGEGVTLGKTLDYVCQTATSYILPTPSPATGTWSGPQVSGNTVTVTGLAVGPHIYTYTEPTLPDACNDIQFTLQVTQQPTADFILSADTVCIGKITTVSPVATSGVTYLVDWGDSTPPGPALSHAYTVEGDFDIMLSVFTQHPVDNSTLCSNMLSKKIHVVRPPQKLAFSLDTPKGCGPLPVAFKNESVAENGQYRWQFGNFQTFVGFQPSGPVVFPPGIEDTTYVVSLTVTTGCDSLVFQNTVTVLATPRANFGITYQQPCSGGILQLNNTSVGNPATNAWYLDGLLKYTSLNPPDQQFFTDSLPRFVVVRLIASNQCGADTTDRTVTVNPTDVVALINLSDTTKICVGDTVTLTSFSTPGTPIRWKTAQGNTFLDNQIQLSFAQPGLYKITLYAEGCGFDSMDVWVRVQPLPNLSVQHPLLVCPGSEASFEVTTSAPGSLLFFGDGDSTNLKISTHRYGAPKKYELKATAVSLAGCRSHWAGQLEVLAPPTAAAEMPDSACSGSPVVFKSLNINGLTCAWQFGDGNFGNGCTVSHTYIQGGLYTALLIVKNDLSCADTALVPVYVRATPSAVVEVEILKKCSPAVVRLTAQLQNATSILWNLGDGSTATTATVEHTYQQGGVYPILLTATNEGICSSTGAATAQVFQTPLFDFKLKENCRVVEGTDLSIITPVGNRPTVTGTNYLKDGTLHPGLPQGFYNVVIDSPEGCQNDTTIYITEPAELTLQVEEDSFDLHLGETAQLNAFVNELNVRLQWLPARWLSSDTILHPLAAPERTVTYVITATDSKACEVHDTVFIAVRIERDSGLYIPNVFTPNDNGAGGPDGVNDLFYIRSVNPAVDHLEDFRVTDKYGEVMHYVAKCPAEQDAYGWDGTLRGQKAEQGVYTYRVVVVYKDGVRTPKSGSLLLVR